VESPQTPRNPLPEASFDQNIIPRDFAVCIQELSQYQCLVVLWNRFAYVSLEPFRRRLGGNCVRRRHLRKQELAEGHPALALGLGRPFARSVDELCRVGGEKLCSVRPGCGEHGQRISEGCRFLVVLLLREEQVPETHDLATSPRGGLYRGTDQVIPILEPGLGRCGMRVAQTKIAEQDGVKGNKDCSAVLLGPADWIGVFARDQPSPFQRLEALG
jgi:hypothetical protein